MATGRVDWLFRKAQVESSMSERRAAVKAANTAERVAAALRRAISSGVLAAGGHVLQEEWAQRLGVSRAPVREAMKMLVAERLLVYDTHRGYFVAELNSQEMSQVYLARMLLEREILRTIRWPDADELQMLKKLATSAVECLVANDVHGALDAARSLQFAIFDFSPLTLLVGEVKRYWGMAELYRSLSMEESLVTDPSASELQRHHQEIFRALSAHDRRGLIEHNTRWRKAMVASFRPRPPNLDFDRASE
jgi:DNA-binding GntR family transcriptional regulator